MRQFFAVKSLLIMFIAACALLVLDDKATVAAARLTIVNADNQNEGFNDPTPAQPVGGNPGTTIGQQRLIAFQFAADVWGATLDSNIEIRITANFDPLTCTATSGTLGSAGPTRIYRNFANAEYRDMWFVKALANKRAGIDINSTATDIRARFNSSLGTAQCLSGTSWYYGLDTNQSPSQTNLVTVLLHEFAHGLGFLSLVDETTGQRDSETDDIFSLYTFDNATQKRWTEMTDSERMASAVNTGNLVWKGGNVTANVPAVLLGKPIFTVNSFGATTTYTVGTASGGGRFDAPGINANIVQAYDSGDVSTTDACQPIVNNVGGSFALIDRGTCTFSVKAKNAQNAGAVGVVIVNNRVESVPPGLLIDDRSVVIPVISVTQADGNQIKSALASQNVTANLTRTSLRAGADAANHAQLYAVNPVRPGSSVSHFDTTAEPNLLMEPNDTGDNDLSVAPPGDLTLPLLRDIGWFADANGDNLPDNLDLSPSRLSVTAKIIKRDCATGEYLVPVTITNIGTNKATNVRMTAATLGAATIAASTYFDDLAIGASATRMLRFPSTAGTQGARVRLSFAGNASNTFIANDFNANIGTRRAHPCECFRAVISKL